MDGFASWLKLIIGGRCFFRPPAAFIAVFLTVWVSVASAGVLSLRPLPGIPKRQIAAKEESIYDRIWNLTDFYHDESNATLQDLSLTGRFHGQYHWADSETKVDNGWETRRARIGSRRRCFTTSR